MNLIHQNASLTIDFSGLTAEESAGALALSGVIAILGVEYSVGNIFDPIDTPTVYAHTDGTVNGKGEGAFAHVAWYDGQDWNVITHPTPEPEPPAAEPTE